MNQPILVHGEKIFNESILYMDGVTVTFDGFRALNNFIDPVGTR